VDDRGSVDDRRGVPGPLLGRWAARLSSSARMSCSDCPVDVVAAGLGAGFWSSGLASMPRSSNWARSSSLVGFAFLGGMLNNSLSMYGS